MSLYLKHRPVSIDKVVGNPEIKDYVSKLLAEPKFVPSSFLIHGPTGCGKTTIARILSEGFGCAGEDVFEINTANFRGIDTVREIIDTAHLKSLYSGSKAYIFDEVHKMTGDAQNALLKILEDSPEKVYFMLCTTEPNKLLPTIVNRCMPLAVSLVSDEDMSRLLRRIVKIEKGQLKEGVTDEIIRAANGSPRMALQILEKVLTVSEDNQLSAVGSIDFVKNESIELCRALMAHNASWKQVAVILSGLRDKDYEEIRRSVLGYAQSVLLKGENDRAASIIESFWEPTYNVGFSGIVYQCYCVIKG